MARHRLGGIMRSPTLLDSASTKTGQAGSICSNACARALSNAFWLGCGCAVPPSNEPR